MKENEKKDIRIATFFHKRFQSMLEKPEYSGKEKPFERYKPRAVAGDGLVKK